MTTEVRYCKDCRWCKPKRNLFTLWLPTYEFARCGYPEAGTAGRHLVSPDLEGPFCSTQREFRCGREGNWWEPKS